MKNKKTFFNWLEKQPASVRAASLGTIFTGVFGLVSALLIGGYTILNTYIQNKLESSSASTQVPVATPEYISSSNLITIPLKQAPKYGYSNFVGTLNQPAGLLETSMIVNILNTTCLSKRYTLTNVTVEVPPYTSDSYDTGLAIDVFAPNEPIIIQSVTLINMGFQNIDISYINEIFETGGFGGGQPLDTFTGEGGNVRPNKSRTDLWGAAPSVRIESKQGITLSAGVNFSEPGVYTFKIEIAGQDINGQQYKFESEPRSLGWILTKLQPSAIKVESIHEFSLCK